MPRLISQEGYWEAGCNPLAVRRPRLGVQGSNLGECWWAIVLLAVDDCAACCAVDDCACCRSVWFVGGGVLLIGGLGVWGVGFLGFGVWFGVFLAL